MITIQNPKDLEDNNLSLLRQNMLDNDPAYNNILNRTKEFYEELLNKGFLDRPYQAEFAALYALRRNNICALSMGLGKTIISGLLICTLYSDKLKYFRPGAIQIIAPSNLSITSRWIEDLKKLSLLEQYLEVIINPKQLTESKQPIWLYTHDFLKRKSKRKKGTIAKELKKRGLSPNLLIVDEAHHFKKGSQRSVNLEILRQKTKRVLLLSGTISDGRLDLLSYLCQLTYGAMWKYSDKEFKNKFGVKKNLSSHYLYGSNNLNSSGKSLQSFNSNTIAEYYELIQTYLHRASHSDPNIFPYVSFPERNTVVRSITPHQDHKRVYTESVNHRLSLIEKLLESESKRQVTEQALEILNSLLQLSSTPPKGIQNNKMLSLLDFVKDYSQQGKKTAIFIRAVRSGREITNELYKAFSQDRVIRLYAQDSNFIPPKQTNDQRNKVLNKFLFDPNVIVGVFSYKLCSESINLTSAEQIILYDYPWSSVEVAQGVHRVIRPGHVSGFVKEVFLYNEGFIDEHQINLLSEKITSNSLLLDLDSDANNISKSDKIDINQILSKLLKN